MSFWKPTESSCTTFKRFYSFKLRLKPYNRGFLLEILKSRENSWLEKKKRCFHFFFQVVSWTSKMQPKTIQKAFFFLQYFLKHDICCLGCPFQKMWECKASGEPWRNLSFSIIKLLNSRESYRRWGKKKMLISSGFPFHLKVSIFLGILDKGEVQTLNPLTIQRTLKEPISGSLSFQGVQCVRTRIWPPNQ